MQFIPAFFFGFPVISYTPSVSLSYYLNVPGLDWNVPELFLILTVLGLATLIPAAWEFTRGAKGQLRMLLLMSIFAAIGLCFSAFVVSCENMHYEIAERELELARNGESPTTYAEESLDRHIFFLEQVLMTYRKQRL